MRLKIRNTKWWLDHVDAWQKSGVTQTEYCRSHKLNLKSFSNWKLKHVKESRKFSEPEVPVFTSPHNAVPLIPVVISEQIGSAKEVEGETLPLPNAGFSGVTLIVKNDYQISLAIGFHPRTLKNVLAVLAE
jgi:hypothetical protein